MSAPRGERRPGRPASTPSRTSTTRDKRANVTFVDDVVDATIGGASAELPRDAVLHVASGHPVAVSTLLDELRSLLLPGDMTMEHRAARRGDLPRTAGRIAMARQHLRWLPTIDLRSGLARQIEWHRQRPQRLARSGRADRAPAATSFRSAR